MKKANGHAVSEKPWHKNAPGAICRRWVSLRHLRIWLAQDTQRVFQQALRGLVSTFCASRDNRESTRTAACLTERGEDNFRSRTLSGTKINIEPASKTNKRRQRQCSIGKVMASGLYYWGVRQTNHGLGITGAVSERTVGVTSGSLPSMFPWHCRCCHHRLPRLFYHCNNWARLMRLVL